MLSHIPMVLSETLTDAMMETFLWSPLPLSQTNLGPFPPKCSNFKSFEIVIMTLISGLLRRTKQLTMKAWHLWSWLVIFAASIVSGAVCFANEQPVVAGGFGAFTFMWLGILWKHMVDTDRDNDKVKFLELGALFRKVEEGFGDTERLRTCIYLEQYSKELQQPKTLPAQETAV